ncbi:MAG: pyridoxal-dependent decarboxylase [Candidatus Eremiobacteraeota bacterium]|nr:pyridoxal-dependent decarboxylase [Candidatus Eremiobacteraeota bacterium]
MSLTRKDVRRVAKWIEQYYDDSRKYRVLSSARPGEIAAALPDTAPVQGESFEQIFSDFEQIIVPGITHWNHPRFFAYFSISAAPVTVLAEALAATLDVNAMLWRTSPAATELEEVVLAWLRSMLGISEDFAGIVYDTASIGGFTALAAAREALDLDIRDVGMTGRELPALRVYITEHTHSHIEKAAIALGVGRSNVVRIPVDDAFRMRPDALQEQIEGDRARAMHPMCIVATVGTTSTTSTDPVDAIAAIAQKHAIWLHVDAAYAGIAAILPEQRHLLAGVDAADSLVVNPHKWLFVPIDLSVLYVRRQEIVKRAFALRADYLTTPEADVRNYMDYGLQLGRRFRALKLWFLLRSYGVRGLQRKLRRHIALAQEFAQWIRLEDEWDVVAPHPLSVVCFRFVPRGSNSPQKLDTLNERVLDAVNASGEIFLSMTKVSGRTALRLAIGNERTNRADVQLAWDVLRRHAREIRSHET